MQRGLEAATRPWALAASLISHSSSSPCAGQSKTSVSFGARGTVTALSLVTLLPASLRPGAAQGSSRCPQATSREGDGEGPMLWVVAVAWPLSPAKAGCGDTPARRVGSPLPPGSRGPAWPCRSRQGRSPATVPTVRQLCAPASYRHCHLAASSKGMRGQRGEDWSLQHPRSRWDFYSPVGSQWALTSLRGTRGQQDQGDKYLSG